jgi:signal transduction histidine kinase
MDPKETSLYHIYLITALVIIGLGLYFIISALLFRSRFRRAYTAQLEAEINKLEEEKKRISEDLHDDIGPMITAIRMKIESLRPVLSSKDQESIEKSLTYLSILSQKIRTASVTLLPSVLAQKGLAIAIEEYISNLPAENTFSIQYLCDPLPALSKPKALHIFRIVQEIIHNTARHAKASRLQVNITATQELIILSTADDGIGFSYEPALQLGKGYGLSNIQSRVQALNGTISIDTGPSKGTRFYMELPVS